METIELKDNEAAFIMNTKGDIKLVLPEFKDDDDVPAPIVYLTALAALTKKDDKLFEYVMDEFYKLTDEIDLEEKE